MEFENAWYLLLALGAPLVIVAGLRRRARPALRFSSLSGLGELPTTWRIWLRWLPDAFIAAALVLMAIAFARPRTGLEHSRETIDGVDIVLAVDVSDSMQYADLAPNRTRLDVVKDVADEFIQKRESDRVGLVVFAKYAYRQAPLTFDRDLVRDMLKALQLGQMQGNRTAIGSGLATAVNALKNSKAKSKVIILLTDGENNFGSIKPVEAAEIASAMEVKVYTIGAGADQVRRTIFGNQRMPAQIDEETLREVSARTGGLYFRAQSRDSLRDVYEQIDQLEKTKIEVAKFTRYQEHFAAYLLPALILIACGLLLANTVFRIGP